MYFRKNIWLLTRKNFTSDAGKKMKVMSKISITFAQIENLSEDESKITTKLPR